MPDNERVVNEETLANAAEVFVPASNIPVFRIAEGRWQNSPDTRDLEREFLEGKIAFGERQEVPVVDPQTNRRYTVPGTQVGLALRQGLRLDVGRTRLESLRRERAAETTAGGAFVRGATRLFDPLGALPGISRLGEDIARQESERALSRDEGFRVGGESFAALDERDHPIASFLGQATSFVAGPEALAVSGGSRLALRGAAAAARRVAMGETAHAAAQIVGRAAAHEGGGLAASLLRLGAEGVAEGVVESARDKISHNEELTAEALTNGGLLGGALGVGIGGLMHGVGVAAGRAARWARARASASDKLASDYIESLRQARLATDGIDINPTPGLPERSNFAERIADVMTGGNAEQRAAMRQLFTKEGKAYAEEAANIFRERLPRFAERMLDLSADGQMFQALVRRIDSKMADIPPKADARGFADVVSSSLRAAIDDIDNALNKPHLDIGSEVTRPQMYEIRNILVGLREAMFTASSNGRWVAKTDMFETASPVQIAQNVMSAQIGIIDQASKMKRANAAQVLARKVADELGAMLVKHDIVPASYLDDLRDSMDLRLAAQNLEDLRTRVGTIPLSPDDDPMRVFSEERLGRIFSRAYSAPRTSDILRLREYLAKVHDIAKRHGMESVSLAAKEAASDAYDLFKASYADELMRRALAREGTAAAALGNALATSAGLVAYAAGVNPIIALAGAVAVRALQRPLASAQQIGSRMRLLRNYTERMTKAVDGVVSRIQGMPVTGQLRRAAPRVGVLALMSSNNREERLAGYEALATSVRNMMIGSEDLQRRIEMLTDSDDELASELGIIGATAISKIYEILPPDDIGAIQPDRLPVVSDTEIQQVYTVARAALDPLSVLEDFADGASVSPDAVDVSREVAPQSWRIIDDRIMEIIGNLPKPPDYTTSLQLSILMQAPMDPTLEGDMVSLLQDRSSNTRIQAVAVGSRNRTARSVRTTVAANNRTVLQAVRELSR